MKPILEHDHDFSARGLCFGIVAAYFYPEIATRLTNGAATYLKEREAATVETFRVPGAFELPLLLRRLAETKKFDALVALGCVIRGETSHFDIVCAESARGLAQVSYDFKIPVGFGLITAETRQQAEARAGGEQGNKGCEAASAALEMIHRLKEVL